MDHQIVKLPYSFDALEPYIDQETMKIHHNKHYIGYVDKLNIALKENIDLKYKTTQELLLHIETIPQDIRTAVINNGGGALNHEMFWSILKKSFERLTIKNIQNMKYYPMFVLEIQKKSRFTIFFLLPSILGEHHFGRKLENMIRPDSNLLDYER